MHVLSQYMYVVTFNNICVTFKDTAISIRCIAILQHKFFNQNMSVESLANETNIVDSLINKCYNNKLGNLLRSYLESARLVLTRYYV